MTRPLEIHHVLGDSSGTVGGPAYFATRLCDQLARVGEHVQIHTLGATIDNSAQSVAYPSSWPILRSFGVSRGMRQSLTEAAQSADIMHSHGLWTMQSIYSAKAVHGTHCSLVVSPAGMLESWALAWKHRRKAAFWRLRQRSVLDSADCFHATSEKEAESIRAIGLNAPIAVVPIGIDIPTSIRSPTASPRRTLLYLGRLHPIKNVELLLRAWSRVQAGHGDWSLRIVGEGPKPYERSLRYLAEQLNLDRVQFAGARYGEGKNHEFESAQIYVLPSHSENFGITVAEALSHAVPVIASTGTPWSGLNATGSGWWIGASLEALSSTLDIALALDPTQLTSMGSQGRSWMERDFSWLASAQSMLTVYRWLANDADKPDFVRIAD